MVTIPENHNLRKIVEALITHLVNKEILDPSTAINIVDEGKI